MTITAIAAAIEQAKPVVAQRFAGQVTALYQAMARDLGPGLPNVVNSWSWARTWNATVKACCTPDRELCPSRTDRAARAYAAATAEAWLDKIMAKLGRVDQAEVQWIDGTDFRVVAQRGADRVVLDQRIIMNVSSRGTIFPQFPARLRVNGKAVAAREFNRAA